jgi:hypothetical protein
VKTAQRYTLDDTVFEKAHVDTEEAKSDILVLAASVWDWYILSLLKAKELSLPRPYWLQK